MHGTRWMAIALAVGALGFAGCGGGGDEGRQDGQSGSGQGGGADQRPAPNASPADEQAGSGGQGKDIFARTCGGCHTRADAGTSGAVGPNLDDLKPDRDRVLAAIEEGPGTMPAGLIGGGDAEAVADYVSESAGS